MENSKQLGWQVWPGINFAFRTAQLQMEPSKKEDFTIQQYIFYTCALAYLLLKCFDFDNSFKMEKVHFHDVAIVKKKKVKFDNGMLICLSVYYL